MDIEVDFRTYLCQDGYVKAEFSVAALDTDLGTVVGDATLEVWSSPDDCPGVSLTLRSTAPPRYAAGWFDDEQVDGYLLGLTQAAENLHAAAFGDQFPAWSCDDDPEKVEISTDVSNEPGRIYLDLPDHPDRFGVLVERDTAYQIRDAIIAARDYLAAHARGEAG